MRRRTLAAECSVHGIGVHTGAAARLVLGPAAWGQGLYFEVAGVRIEADLTTARGERGSTVLSCRGREVRTPEHVLAALSGLGVTDARLVLEGPEVPIGDGSALPWVEALDAVGWVEGPPLEALEVATRVEVEGFGGRAWLAPGAGRRLTVEVDYGRGGPQGSLDLVLDEAGFRGLAAARTFVLREHAEAARAAGLGRGATADNTVVWPGADLRMPDEPVRHKALDAVGDLALLGPWAGHLHVQRGSHRLHHRLARAVHAALP
jgi:UDP-3-O-[3-hydroxymyristoyl] N-acetylglucosamine deacetylase